MAAVPTNQDFSDHPDYYEPHPQQTLLLDIPFDDVGPQLTLMPSPIEFIHSRYRFQVAAIFVKYITHLMEDQYDLIRWLKLLYLPCILFVDTNGHRLSTLLARLALLANDDWSQFKIGMFAPRKIPDQSRNVNPSASSPASKDPETMKHDRALKLVRAGEFSRAYSLLMSTATIAEVDLSVLDTLKNLHPQRHNPADPIFSEPISDSFRESIAATEVTPDDFARIVRESPRRLAAPITKMTYDHHRQLIGDRLQPVQIDYVRCQAAFATLIANGLIPDEVAYIYAGPELIALRRGVKTRPLTLGIVDRNIPGKLLLQTPECRAVCRDYLSAGGQKGVNVSNGAEQVIHSVEAGRTFRPSRNILQADYVNAFNSAHRNDMLREVKEQASFMYAYCRKLYAAKSTLSVYSSVSTNGNVFKITSAEGAQQGCVHGSFDYCIGTHPFLLRLANELPEQEFNEFFLAFIDDLTGSLDDEYLVKTLDIMLDEGPASGLYLSREKTKVLVGLKPSFAEAFQLKHILTDPNGHYRLRPENVILHPDNSSTPWSQYGLVVLGAPVGALDYKHAFMEELLVKLTNEHRILQKIADPQCKFLLLNYCFSKKLTYALRTISPSITQPYLTEFNALIDSLLSDIMQLDADINDESAISYTIAQSRLRINDGGLGLGLLDLTSTAAYLASIVACLPTIYKYEKDFLPSLLSPPSIDDSSMVEDIKAAVSTINYCNYDMATILRLSGLNLETGEHHDEAITTQLQHKFLEPHYEAARLAFSQSLVNLPNETNEIFKITMSEQSQYMLLLINHLTSLSEHTLAPPALARSYSHRGMRLLCSCLPCEE